MEVESPSRPCDEVSRCGFRILPGFDEHIGFRCFRLSISRPQGCRGSWFPSSCVCLSASDVQAPVWASRQLVALHPMDTGQETDSLLAAHAKGSRFQPVSALAVQVHGHGFFEPPSP